MSENTEIWNLNALCRCCHKDGYFKGLKDTYFYENKPEVYAQMLQDTFGVEIQQPILEASNTICEDCIWRLREACHFKKQVQECEIKFEVYCKNELATRADEPIKKELDYDNDCDSHFNNEEYEVGIQYPDPSDLPKKEEKDFINGVKNIKSEDSENKCTIQVEITPDIEVVTNEKEHKKRMRKKFKPKWDINLVARVKTDSGTLYSCKICGGSFTKQVDMKEHIINTHTEFECKKCEQKFHTRADRRTHVKSIHKLECHQCKMIFKTRTEKSLHMKIHITSVKNEKFQCDICFKEFVNKGTLRVHMRGHYGTKKKCVCHICGRGFNDSTNLRIHISTVHEKNRPFACEICPKTFTAKKHLTVHIKKHNGEFPFECDECPKKFVTISCLKAHKQSSHAVNGQKYRCKVCLKTWFNKKSFLVHLRRNHVGERPYKCSICNMDFTCKYSMRRHEASHDGVKFQCDHCDAKFSQKAAVKRHADRKHLNVLDDKEKVKCDVCNKNVTDLKKHMLCHNNKRYSCEFCGKCYSENNVLTRHKKNVHFGIKPHVCQYCDKGYVKINALRNHLMKVHKVVSKVDNDEDFGSAVTMFSIKNKKGKIKTEDGGDDIPYS